MEAEIIEPKPELRLILVRAPDDPPLAGPEFQKELSEFRQLLYAHGIQIESRSFAVDAAHGGGGLSGEFIIACTALGLLAKQLAGPLTTYLKGRSKRKVRVQFREGGQLKSIEAQDAAEVERIITAAAEYYSKISGNESTASQRT
jgi:hypothetical protein